ncbi:ABC transporter substrate-binding protein [Yoonia sp.]|uniref:ABC transporter substrate-binding protein n=1 Tax=Yoonia sp. TaxID=2212373 RepID=UPI00391D146E
MRLPLLFLALCLATPAAALDCPDGQRAFTHQAGETCIPSAPQRIVSLREDRITTALLDIGAPIIGTAMSRMDDGSSYVRGASDIFGQDVVDAANLLDLGSHNPPDLEAVAAAQPDLIFAMDYQSEALAQLSAIAPTLIVPVNQPYLDYLAWLADAAGMADSFATDLARYEARIATARATIGDPSAITVSRFDLWDDGLWFYPNWGAIDQVIDDLGFDRPAVQAEAAENISGMSFERIAAFDGDIVLSSRAPRFGQSTEMLQDQWDSVAPFWRDLPGVAAGNHYWYDRDIWVGYSFASLDAVIDGLVLLTAGRGVE